MNESLSEITVKQLQKAIKIKTKLEALQARLDDILGDGGAEPPGFFRKKRRMSAAGRAAIAAAARRRWAKYNGKSASPAKKGRRKMSASARAAISAAAKARWRAVKAAGKTRL
jgi:hypothetical protein